MHGRERERAEQFRLLLGERAVCRLPARQHWHMWRKVQNKITKAKRKRKSTQQPRNVEKICVGFKFSCKHSQRSAIARVSRIQNPEFQKNIDHRHGNNPTRSTGQVRSSIRTSFQTLDIAGQIITRSDKWQQNWTVNRHDLSVDLSHGRASD